MTSNYSAELSFYALLLVLIPLYRVFASTGSSQSRGALLAGLSAAVFLVCGFPMYLLVFYIVGAFMVALYGYAVFRAREAAPRRQGQLLGLGVLALSLLLVFLNYRLYFRTLFFESSLQAYLSSLAWVGISFFTFRAIDVLIYASSSLTHRYSLWRSMGYLLFFPTFLLGPINRYASFVKDLEASPRPLAFLEVRDLLLRMGLGVIKAFSLAPLFLQHSIFTLQDAALPVSALQVFLACYASYLYIYIEFSGYSDIAIAVARFFNIAVPENFHFPFLASSIKDFWNRWHISFAHWCRDNIFFVLLRWLTLHVAALPAFGSQLFAIFVTFLFMGAWHGDSLNWIFYGLYHAFGMCAWYVYNKLCNQFAPDFYDRLSETRAYKVFCTVLTFHFVALGLLLTRELSFLGRLFS